MLDPRPEMVSQLSFLSNFKPSECDVTAPSSRTNWRGRTSRLASQLLISSTNP
jgi:hypothetical protein